MNINKKYYKESIYKQYKKLEVVEEDKNFTHYYNDHYTWDTNYNLFNTKTKKIVLEKMRSPCFVDITTRGFIRGEVKKSNYRLDIFVPSCEVRLTKKEVYRFVSHLRCIGKFKFKTLKNYRLNYPRKDDKTIRLRKAQDVYLLQMNLSDFKSLEHVKLLTHTFRYVYEGDLYLCIKDFFSFRYNEFNINKKIPFLSTFYSLARCFRMSLRGHLYSISASVLNNKTFINNFIGDIDNYNNSAFSSINKSTAVHLSYRLEGWGNAYTSEKYSDIKISKYKSYFDYLKDVKKDLEKLKIEFKGVSNLKVVNYG